MFDIIKKNLFLPILLFYMFSAHGNESKQEYLLLITGCARSGTLYISKLLTTAGLKIAHEHFRGKGIEGISSC